MNLKTKINAILSDKIGRQIRKVTLNPYQRHRLQNYNFSILS